MSPRCLFAVVALGATVASSSFAQTVAPAPGTGPAPAPAPAITPEQIFEAIGWFIADRNKVGDFGLNDAELGAFQKGVRGCIQGQPPPPFMEEAMSAAQQFVTQRMEAANERAAVGNRAEEAAELAKLDQNPAVQKTASGLRFEIVAPGTDPKPTLADTVVAHYILSFADGTVKESSRESGQPAEFPLGGVVPAWQEGMQLIGSGGRIKLYVPSALGYGPQGSPGGIPPAKMLFFDVELVAVKAAPVQLPAAPGMPVLTP